MAVAIFMKQRIDTKSENIEKGFEAEKLALSHNPLKVHDSHIHQ